MLASDGSGAPSKLVLVADGLLTVLLFSFRNSRELHGLGQGELYVLVLPSPRALVLAVARRTTW